MLRKYLLPVSAFALLMFAVIHVVRGQQQPSKLEPPAQPARTPYGKTVAGAGIIEAQTENIAVGSALPGVVTEVYVSVEQVGKKVKKGDPLFRVDDRALKAQLRYLEASLAAAEAQLARLDAMPRPEELPPSEAKVKTAEANVALQRDLADRAARLLPSGAMSQEDVRQRQLSLAVSKQQLAQAQADYELLKAGAWAPDKAVSRAAIEQARAQVEQTKTEIVRTLVCAPVDGDVLQVNVRPGEYVSTPSNQPLVMLGAIHKLHVRVDIDEHDIPRFTPGAPARAMLRGNAQIQLPLTFVRVEPYVVPKKSLTGDNTERVDTRVLQVIYSIDARDRPLYVGQQVDVFVDVHAAGK
ncbi:MAG: efflux RND transporter periplasmic adaptor subunit [Gemmataceae bacterium]|nr:efflux RND transporter periplasmic adaptor subunit [Gemmataceae bacterium]